MFIGRLIFFCFQLNVHDFSLLRAIAFCERNFSGQVADVTELKTQFGQLLIHRIKVLFISYVKDKVNSVFDFYYIEFDFSFFRLRDGLKCVLDMSRYGNRYLQLKQPWVKCKGSDTDR